MIRFSENQKNEILIRNCWIGDEEYENLRQFGKQREARIWKLQKKMNSGNSSEEKSGNEPALATEEGGGVTGERWALVIPCFIYMTIT